MHLLKPGMLVKTNNDVYLNLNDNDTERHIYVKKDSVLLFLQQETPIENIKNDVNRVCVKAFFDFLFEDMPVFVKYQRSTNKAASYIREYIQIRQKFYYDFSLVKK